MIQQVTPRHLCAAIPLAVVVHIVAAISMFWVSPPPGAQAVGPGGVEVSLGPSGGAPGDVAFPTPSDVQVVQPPDVGTEQPQEDVPTKTTEFIKAIELEPVIPEETPSVDIIPLQEVVEAVPVLPLPPKPERKRPPPEPKVIEPPEQMVVKETVPVSPEMILEVVEAAEPPPEQIAIAPSSIAGAGGKSGSEDSIDAGGANNTSGGGTPGAAADYMSYLLAWLQKHKEYPRAAQRRRLQGTVLLYFEMDRQGKVHDFRLQRSSGYGLLDTEVLALIQRAKPLPPPPPEVKDERIKLVVPVSAKNNHSFDAPP